MSCRDAASRTNPAAPASFAWGAANGVRRILPGVKALARPRSWSRLAVVAVVLAVVAGCASPAATPTPQPSAVATSPAASQATSRPSGTPLAWTDCGAPLQCATLSVPLDYAAGGPAVAHISLIRLPATDRARRIGSLVTNPGGPGGSGVDFVRAGRHYDLPGDRP